MCAVLNLLPMSAQHQNPAFSASLRLKPMSTDWSCRYVFSMLSIVALLAPEFLPAMVAELGSATFPAPGLAYAMFTDDLLSGSMVANPCSAAVGTKVVPPTPSKEQVGAVTMLALVLMAAAHARAGPATFHAVASAAPMWAGPIADLLALLA